MTKRFVVNREKRREQACTALAVFGLALVLGLLYDYYYAINDDGAIKDILAGAYTGKPEARCVQLLYPLGLLLTFPYRLLPGLPWYGLFLCFCQFGAIWVVADSLLCRVHKKRDKGICLAVVLFAFVALFLWELIYVQYTVTAGLLVLAALFRFFLTPVGWEKRVFWRHNALSVVLLLLAFCLRSEMMLLLCPLFCVAGLIRWHMEGTMFSRENREKFGGLLVLLGAGMAVCIFWNRAAYSSSEWQQFMSLFDARTEVYDYYDNFHGVPPYEENREFYESIGLSENGYGLLENYNFSLEEGIDDVMLWKIADYAALARTESIGRRLYACVYAYVWHFFSAGELPWNLLVFLGYFLWCRQALRNRDKDIFWKAPLLGIVRSVLWLFLYYRGRYPERITHPLYLMELGLLFLLLTGGPPKETGGPPKENGKKYTKAGILSLYVVLLLCGFLLSSENTSREAALREQVNRDWQQAQSYCGERGDSFYFVDVYSTVAYSEKMFTEVDNGFRNYELLGGWAAKSPLMEEKLAYAGVQEPYEALLGDEKVYFLIHRERPADWLIAFYQEKGKEIELRQMGEAGPFVVLRAEER